MESTQDKILNHSDTECEVTDEDDETYVVPIDEIDELSSGEESYSENRVSQNRKVCFI